MRGDFAMATVDLDDVQRTIAALATDAHTRADGNSGTEKEIAQLCDEEIRARERILQPLIGRVGTDFTAILRELGANGRSAADDLRRLRQPSSAAVEAGKARFALTSEQLRANIGVLNGVVVQPGPETVVVLPQPSAILVTPPNLDALRDTSITPYDSRAKFVMRGNAVVDDSGKSLSPQSVDFWYFWHNDNEYGAWVTVAAPVVLNGTMDAECGSGGLGGDTKGSAGIAEIGYFYAPGTTRAQLITNGVNLGRIELSAGLFATDSASYRFDHQQFGISGTVFVGGGPVYFKISLSFSLEFWQGMFEQNGDPANEVNFDFATDRFDYFLQSPLLRLDVRPYDPFSGTS
jgi:hypothetical protein